MRFPVLAAFALLASLALAGCSLLESGELSVSVKDSSGNPLEGVELKVISYNDNQSVSFHRA